MRPLLNRPLVRSAKLGALAAAVALVVTSSPVLADKPATVPSASTSPLWKMPAKATVTEETLKDGKRAKTRYQVTMATDKASGKILVEHKRFKFLALDGLDLKNPLSKTLVAKLEKQAATAIPGMLIDPVTGRFYDIVGLDRMTKRLAKAGLLSAEEAKQFKAMMKTPGVVRALKREVSQVWLCWAGIWAAGTPSPVNPVVLHNLTLDVVGHPFPFLVQVLGGPSKDGKTLNYRFESELTEASSKKHIGKFKRGLKLVTGGRRGDDLTGISKTLKCEVKLDAKTQRPLRVVRTDTTVLYEKKDGKKKLTPMKESHTYTFKWSR